MSAPAEEGGGAAAGQHAALDVAAEGGDTPVEFLIFLKKQGIELSITVRRAFLLGVSELGFARSVRELGLRGSVVS